MSSNSEMRPPYYILINDKDPKHLRFYHEYHFGDVQYENEFGDYRPETAAYITEMMLWTLFILEYEWIPEQKRNKECKK